MGLLFEAVKNIVLTLIVLFISVASVVFLVGGVAIPVLSWGIASGIFGFAIAAGVAASAMLLCVFIIAFSKLAAEEIWDA